MAAKELTVAKARAETAKGRLLSTVDELKYRLKPSMLASDAWHSVRDTGTNYATKGAHAVSDRPAAAGGAVVAVALFLLRHPLARLLGRMFGTDGGPGRVTTTISHKNDDYDLTAPVVSKK